MKNKTFIIIIICILLLASMFIVYDYLNKQVTESKAKMKVGKVCVELEETKEQFRAKQDLWSKAFGFSYIECK